MVKKSLFLSILVSILPLSTLIACFVEHPGHMSVCEITYNPRTERLELVQHISLKDLEEALQHYGKNRYLDIMHPRDPVAFDSLLQAYYVAQIRLSVDHEKHALRYLGHERLNNNMCIYMEGERKLQRAPSAFRIQNVLLFEQFKEQKNRINLRIGEQYKSVLLHRDRKAQDVTF